MDAINPAHGSVLRVNSPSLGIFSLRSSSSPVHPASGGSEGGNGEPDEDGRGEDGKRSEMEHGEKRAPRRRGTETAGKTRVNILSFGE